MVHIKEGVLQNAPYIFGKQDTGEAGSDPTGMPLARLAANENPYGPLPSVLDAITTAVTMVNRYPNPMGVPLREAIAAKFGVTLDHVVIGPGAGALCETAVASTCGPGEEVLIGWPSFIGYSHYASVAGATIAKVALTADSRYDLPALAAAVNDRTRAVIICNPNNPTGTVVTADELVAFLESVSPEVLVILDEAYIEFADPTVCAQGVDVLSRFSNVVVLRTFSKAYGLAGLRAGYAIAQPETLRVISKAQPPFQVNNIGQAAAIACLAADDELAQRTALIRAERVRLVATLAELGHDVPEQHANFVWLPMNATQVTDLNARLEAKGVLTRPLGAGLRVTVGSPAENDRFLDALTS